MNATIMKGERSKLLAVAVVIAMVACALVAFMPTADADEETPAIEYTPIDAADFLGLDTDSDGTIVLDKNYKLNDALTVSDDLIIDLAGHSIVNGSDNHTITVAKGGDLTVKDSSETKTGTVDNITHAKGAIYINNGATVTLNGGTFERSMEASTSPTNNGGNSWYTIWNGGDLTINEGATVLNGNGSTTGFLSSIIKSQGTADSPATLTINGATIIGGLYIYNSDYSTLMITGGTITGTNSAVFNISAVEITGGTFGVIEGADDSSVIWTSDYTGNTNDVSISISGATINGSIAEGVANDARDEFGGNVKFDISADTTYDSFIVLAGDTAEGTISTADEDITFSGITDVNITVADGKIEVSSLNVPAEGTFVVPETIEVVNNGVIVNGTSATVTTEQGLKDAIANDAITEITIDGEIEITSVVTVDRAVTIIGADGAKLVAIPNDGPYDGEYSEGTDKYILNITAGATIQNLTVDSLNAAFGINVWSGESKIIDVASINSAGAAFTIGGGATVTMDGTSASGYAWGGVNADKSATVTFADVDAFESIGSVYGEDSTGVKVNLPENYKAAIEMTGKWGTGKTDFKGYYTTLDEVLPYYEDTQNRFNYENSKITVNKNATNGKDFTLRDGTTLDIDENATLTNEDGVSFYVEKGATVTGLIRGGEIEYEDVSEMKTFPDMEDGTIVSYEGRKYVVYHADTMSGNRQFGVAVGDFTYTGFNKAGNFRNAAVISLDNIYGNTSGVPTGYVYNQDEVSSEEASNGEYGTCTNVGTYTLHISFTMTNGKETVNVDVEVPINILPANSEITIGNADGYDQYQDVTITGSRNEYIANGTVIYTTYDGETGYHLFFTVTAPEGITLTQAMIDGIDYADGIGHHYLGTEVPDEIVFNVDFDGIVVEEGAPNNYTNEEYTISLTGITPDKSVVITPWTGGSTTVYKADGGAENAIEIDDTTDLIFTDETYGLRFSEPVLQSDGTYLITVTGALKYIDGADRYYLPIKVTGLLPGATVSGCNQNLSDDGTYSTGVLRVTSESPSDVIKVKQGEDYNEITYRLDFSGLQLESAADFSAGAETSYYGQALAGFGTNLKIETAENGDIVFSGELSYIYPFTGYSAGAMGWFFPWDVTTPIMNATLTSATGTMGDLTNTGIDHNVTQIRSAGSEFVIDLDGSDDKYIPKTYNFVYDVDCIEVVGFDEDADVVIGEMGSYGFADMTVGDNTMYIIFNPLGNTSGELTITLNDANAVGQNTWTADPEASAAIAYVTFDSVPETGAYDMNVDNAEGEQIATAVVSVGGLLGKGYGDKTLVESDLKELGITVTDATTRTMWIAWNNDEEIVGTVTGYLYIESEDGTWTYVYDETLPAPGSSKWNEVGPHSWYFSFDVQLKDKFQYGNYRMDIVVNNDTDNPIVTGYYNLVDKSVFNVTLDEDVDLYDRNFTVDINEDPLFYVPGTGNPDRTLNYWYLVDAEGEPILDSNGDVQKIKENGLLDFSDLKFEGITGQDIYLKAEYGTSSGGSDSDDQPRQLWDYEVRYVYNEADGSITVYIVTDKIEGYYNELKAVTISYLDIETFVNNQVNYYLENPLKTTEDGMGIVAEYSFDNVGSSGNLVVNALFGNTWVSLVDCEVYDGRSLLAEDMTFEIVEAPADAPADNNYPWVQVNYQRLQDVDSVEFYVDDVLVENLVWVDSSGEPIQGAPELAAGSAFLQLSIKDGEIAVGQTVKIVATNGALTETIEAVYSATL